MILRMLFAVGSSKRAGRTLYRRRPPGVAGRKPVEDVGRFCQSDLRHETTPCRLRAHLNSCVPFPRTSFAVSSSVCRPIVPQQRFGTMDALTPLPTGLPACDWPHRFGLRRFAPTLGLGPALACFGLPVRYSGTSGHLLGRGLLGSPPRFFRTAQSGTTWGRPRRYGSLSPSRLGASTWWAAWPRFPLGLIHRFNLSRLTAQFFAFWPTAPSLAGTHCQSATSPVGLRRGLDFNQLEAGITPRHPPLLSEEGNTRTCNSFTPS